MFIHSDQGSFDIGFKLKNQQFGETYDFSKLPQSPDIFFKEAWAETEEVNDTVFIVYMAGNQYSDWFSVELIMWIKDNEGNYHPERYKTSISENSEFFDIKKTK